MSMKVIRLSSLLFAFVFAASAFCFDFPVLAGNLGQNSNSSTTVVENSNTAAPSRRSGRRGRRRAATAMPDTMSMPAATDSAAMPAAQTMATTEQTDLSGTYTGAFDCTDAGVSGDTTLTITGNQFTLADGKTGRIVASTTQGYTGVAMQFGESTAATATTPATVPTIVSMRAKKSGDRLTLMAVPGSGRVCSFTPAAAARMGRTRRARSRATPAMPAMPATPAEPTATPTPAMPAEPATPATDAGPMPPATPTNTPTRRGRRGRRGNTNTNSNTNMNSNTSTNDNTGEGNVNTNAKPTPTPPVPRN
jgi:hypothetical protein